MRATVKQRPLGAAGRDQARRHDQAQLARSKRREDRIQQLILAAIAREQRPGGGYHGPTGGLLMRPVNGPITSPFGYRIHPIYHYWGLHDGDDFGAACGQPLYAVGGGTVMSEYYSSVWGNRLYLNLGLINGKNVTVIYNHLSRLPRRHRCARPPRPGRRASRHHRLVHRLPPALHGDGQRHAREPDELVLS